MAPGKYQKNGGGGGGVEGKENYFPIVSMTWRKVKKKKSKEKMGENSKQFSCPFSSRLRLVFGKFEGKKIKKIEEKKIKFLSSYFVVHKIVEGKEN